jgi:hypothetical protein
MRRKTGHPPFKPASPEQQRAELAELSAGYSPLIRWQHMPVQGEEDAPEVTDDPAVQLEIWQARFGAASPKEVCQSLMGDFSRMPGQGATLYLSDEGVYPGDPHPITLVYRKGELQAQFNLQVMEPLDQAPEAYLADAYVDALSGQAKGRGTGLGGQITLQVIDTLKRFPNVEKLLVHAEKTGSYAWAKMGFELNEEAWRENKQRVRQRLEEVRDQLQGEPRVVELLDKALLQSDPRLMRDMIRGLKKKTSFGVDPENTDRALDLGKFLFRNLPWEGHFDLKNPDSHKALADHVAGHAAGRG